MNPGTRKGYSAVAPIDNRLGAPRSDCALETTRREGIPAGVASQVEKAQNPRRT